MIEHYAPQGEANEARLLLRPNLSLSLGQLSAFFATLAATTVAVAGLAWWQGNAFAPVFAALYLSMLAICLGVVWRRGRRAEVIALAADRLTVRRLPELVEVFADHAYWVRVVETGDQVTLVGHGLRVVVGSFLGEQEKRQLAQALRQLLCGAAQPGGGHEPN